MQFGAGRQPLNGQQATPIGILSRQETAWCQVIIDQNKAGAALAGFAAVFDTEATQPAEHIDQKLAGLGLGIQVAVIEVESNVHGSYS